MKMKKLLPVMLAVVLVAVVGIGATLAYFTDNDEATNVITMGHVDVELTEPSFDTEDGAVDNAITNIVPGMTIAKDPTITLGEESMDAFIRVKLEVTGFDGIENEEEKAGYVADILGGLVLKEGWTMAEDGYCYYKPALTNDVDVENGNVAVLFDEVVIPAKWNNAVANETFNIVVSVEAVQADNFTDVNEDGTWTLTAEEILAYNEAE